MDGEGRGRLSSEWCWVADDEKTKADLGWLVSKENKKEVTVLSQ